jgi:hypothetical protein
VALIALTTTARQARAQSDIAFPASVYAERRARLANTSVNPFVDRLLR